MRLAQVAPPFEAVPPAYYGGTERVVSLLTEEMVRRGHEVTLFASGDSTTAARLIPTVETALWHQSEGYDPYVFWAITLGEVYRRAARGEADLIHSHLDFLAFACAVLALDVTEAAGAPVPGVTGEAIAIAHQTTDCAADDIVACAQVGTRGARAAGLTIPGVDPGQVADDARKCGDGDFAACLNLGKTAADAAGLPGTSLTGAATNAQGCIGGDLSACTALGQDAARAGVPIGGVAHGADNALQCTNGDSSACRQLGQSIAAAVR